MIITHTTNIHGQARIYLGGTGSLQAWIEPKQDKIGWTFNMDTGIAGTTLDEKAKREWAVHLLLKLAEELNIAPNEIASTPFEMIASLHTPNPTMNRRMPTPRREVAEHCYMATDPKITRPHADFRFADYDRYRRTR